MNLLLKLDENFLCSMTAWDVQHLIIRLGDYNIKSTSDVTHLERKALKIIRHKGFNPRTLVSFQNKN